MRKNFMGRTAVFTFLSLSLFACQKDISTPEESTSQTPDAIFRKANADVEGITFYALAGNTLDKYSTSNPEMVLNSATITGVQPGEKILGVDFRPATAQLYALGSNSRLYTIDPSTGVATFVAALSTVPAGSSSSVPLALSGSSFGFDFNPVVDRIRIVSNTGQNLRANPATGVTIVDGNINPSPASVNGVAYNNNDIDAATGTKLFALDVTSDILYEINPPNNGTLSDPISVKLKLEGDGGFDIAPRNANVTTDIGLGLYDVNKKSTLFTIDVETGETRILAKYNKSIMYSAIAISPAL